MLGSGFDMARLFSLSRLTVVSESSRLAMLFERERRPELVLMKEFIIFSHVLGDDGSSFPCFDRSPLPTFKSAETLSRGTISRRLREPFKCTGAGIGSSLCPVAGVLCAGGGEEAGDVCVPAEGLS